MNAALESIWKTYEMVNNWIRFSDAKAGAILTADGVLVGIFLALLPDSSHYPRESSILVVLLLLGTLSGCLSVYYSLKCILPTLKIGEPHSLVFFGHVANKFNSPIEYTTALTESFSDEKQIISQVSYQVWANSKVAWKKYQAVSWATRFLIVTIVFLIVGIIFTWF